jgi:serine protease Do
MNQRSFVSRVALLLLIVVGFGYTANGQQDQQRRFLPTSLFRAFRDVIREPGRSTVQVYSDGYRAAFGAIVRADGHVVTKASELKGKIEVQLSYESQKREAKIIARDPATDLAVLKIEASNLPVVPWSTNESPAVGTWLATPGLIPDPISIGVVSVAARKISPPQAALGVQLDLADNVARITTVVPGMPAAKAGLRDGDVIRKLNGIEIIGRPHLQETIRAHQPGDKVSIVFERDGRLQTIEVTLGNMTELVHDERSEFQNSLGGSLSERRNGFPLAIQHDSVLRPADCGGPVVDIDGKVVGINIARAGRVESYALPAALVRETVDKLLKTELTSTSAATTDDAAPRRAGQER